MTFVSKSYRFGVVIDFLKNRIISDEKLYNLSPDIILTRLLSMN